MITNCLWFNNLFVYSIKVTEQRIRQIPSKDQVNMLVSKRLYEKYYFMMELVVDVRWRLILKMNQIKGYI